MFKLNVFASKNSPRCLNTFPSGRQFDEDTILIDSVGFVHLYELQRFGYARFFVERQPDDEKREF